MNSSVEKVIQLYSIITDISDHDIIMRDLMKSETFNALLEDNEALLYEGYCANMLDIAKELTNQGIKTGEMFTPEKIRMINQAKRCGFLDSAVLQA